MKRVQNVLPPYVKVQNGELWLTEDDRENLKISYRIKDIIFSERSDFQHVMILDSYDFGRMLVLDGVVHTTSIDGHI
ncbi:spermidine synthase, partial [Parageobacillus sp. SY1]